MHIFFAGALALAMVASAGCSSGPADTGPAATESPAKTGVQPDAPATLTDVNVVAGDMGGGIEEMSGFFGPGFSGRRLIDGRSSPTWRLDWFAERIAQGPRLSVDGPIAKPARLSGPSYPFDIVFSFFDRQPALVGGVTIVLPDKNPRAPKEVEIWTSMKEPPDSFVKAGGQTLAPQSGEQTISFPAREARFVKLRVVSGIAPTDLEVAEVRVLESARPGYVPLFTRAEGAAHWKASPHEAAQRGLEWLQQAAVNWSEAANCFGCHVQGQVIMGQAVALNNGYRVSLPALRSLAESTRRSQSGSAWNASSPTATAFAAMALSYEDVLNQSATDPAVSKAAGFLAAHQTADGALPAEQLPEPPIVQGQFGVTANAVVAMDWAATHGGDPKYKAAASNAVAWVAASDPVVTQDKVFKILALTSHGSSEQQAPVWPLVEELSGEQQPDGGWKELPSMKGSNALATGQVLYAYKRAGVSIHSPVFRRGVDFLLKTQVNQPTLDNGVWRSANSQSRRQSDFVPTMWAVIGLAGAYGKAAPGALEIVRRQGDRAPTRNLEIVLDVSGSMNTKLGAQTRWQTALGVLKQVVATIPDDFNVGLRVYGHRYASKSAQTCTDTQLVAPIARLDRDRILSTASKLRPRGETPLIRSVLETITDLRAAGGGSVILITDGEESCKGDPKDAAAKIKASGLNVTLNIVGFTLVGRTVEADLTALAGSTGGRYYGADNGEELSKAVMMAAVQRMPYEILDAAGKTVATGDTSELARDLPNGSYTVRVRALEQALETKAEVTSDRLTTVTIEVEGDRFVIRP